MRYICIIGDNENINYLVKENLTMNGFKACTMYTTVQYLYESNKGNYKLVNNQDFTKLVNNEFIIKYADLAEGMCGIPKPYGATQYVIETNLNAANELRKVYGKQVEIIYLKSSNRSIDRCSIDTSADLVINVNEEMFEEISYKLERYISYITTVIINFKNN